MTTLVSDDPQPSAEESNEKCVYRPEGKVSSGIREIFRQIQAQKFVHVSRCLVCAGNANQVIDTER